MAILGISLGTRFFGYAIIHDRELLDWGVKSSLDTWKEVKLRRILHIVSILIDLNGIERVAVKIPDILPNSQGFNQLIGALNALLESKGIKATYYSLSQLKKRYCGNTGVNKDELITAMLKLYPELRSELQKERKNKIPYYVKIFEAVAAAS